jgi:hypothetical protein
MPTAPSTLELQHFMKGIDAVADSASFGDSELVFMATELPALVRYFMAMISTPISF